MEFSKKVWKDVTNLNENTFEEFENRFEFNILEKILQNISHYASICLPNLVFVRGFADEDGYMLLKLIFQANVVGI